MDNEEAVTENPPSESIQNTEIIPAAEQEAPTSNLRAELALLSTQTVTEQRERIIALEAQLKLSRENATPVRAEPEDPAHFLNAPRQAIRDEINTSIAEQIKPLKDFVFNFEKQNQYTRLVDAMKTRAPALYAAYLEDAGNIDQLMQNQDPTPNNMQACILMSRGAASLGLSENRTPPTPPTQPKVSPPNLPSSPPPAPRKVPVDPGDLDAKVAALTESERKAARLMQFKDLKEYVKYRDLPDDTAVSDWKV